MTDHQYDETPNPVEVMALRILDEAEERDEDTILTAHRIAAALAAFPAAETDGDLRNRIVRSIALFHDESVKVAPHPWGSAPEVCFVCRIAGLPILHPESATASRDPR